MAAAYHAGIAPDSPHPPGDRTAIVRRGTMGRFQLPAYLLSVVAGGAIAIEAPVQDQAVAEAAVESCNQALGQATCRLAGAADIAADFYVRVAFFDAQQLESQVEIRREPSLDAPIAVRHVSFAAADDLRQRYRAIGLIIAAYVVAHPEPSLAPKPPPEPPPSEPLPEPPPAVEVPAPELRLAPGADLAALAGAGLERGPPRFGLLLRGHLSIGSFPLRPLIALRLAHRFEQPTLYWLSAGGGLTLALLPEGGTLGLEVRGEFVAERLIAEAVDPTGQETDSGGQWRFGGRLGLDVLLRVSRGLWLFVGADASLLAPSVYVDVYEDEVGVDPTLGWVGSLGVRLVP